jgi:hypothetical protein
MLQAEELVFPAALVSEWQQKGYQLYPYRKFSGGLVDALALSPVGATHLPPIAVLWQDAAFYRTGNVRARYLYRHRLLRSLGWGVEFIHPYHSWVNG